MSRLNRTAPLVFAGVLLSASMASGQPARAVAPEAAAQAEQRGQPGTIGRDDDPDRALNGSVSGAEPRSADELAVPSARDSRLQVKTQNGVDYVSGGVSREEEDAITAMGKRFNLKLTLQQASGEYMGGAHVRIDNTRDHGLVDTESDGPLFFAKLAPGTYTIRVSGEGQQFTKVVEVRGAEQQQLSFVWPREGRRGAGDTPLD